MMIERDDPIIETGLSEMLGGQTPPDLTARILQAAAARQQSSQPAQSRRAASLLPPSLLPPSVGQQSPNGQVAPVVSNGTSPVANGRSGHPDVISYQAEVQQRRESVGQSSATRSSNTHWVRQAASWAVPTLAASLVLGVIGLWAVRPTGAPLANRPVTGKTSSTTGAGKTQDPNASGFPAVSENANDRPGMPTPDVHRPGDVEQLPVSPQSVDVATAANRDHDPNQPQGPANSALGSATEPKKDNLATDSIGETVPRGAPSSDDDVIALIDARIRKRWLDEAVQPSPPATDAEWCRRLYLDLLGRIPTVDEVLYFVEDKSADKRHRLVDRLLFSEQYAQEFTRNWATIWTNLLIGRSGGRNNDRPVNRAGLQKWIRDGLYRNRPYDKFVEELIAADGTNTPGDTKFNGAVNFLLDNLQDKQVPATIKVSQLFLGMRVGCTQCHNHPFNDWKQDQFWGMNAFFKQARAVTDRDGDLEVTTLTDANFAGEGNDPEEAEIYYELRNGLLKVAYPTFVDGTTVGRSGFVEDVNRRDELARLVTASPYLGEALANRLWGHFFGFGFVRPIDDMGPHNPPSHPELVADLGRLFAAGGHDQRRLMRWIVLSEAYGLSSRILPENQVDAPDKGETPLFTHFYSRQMRAEELYESLLAATQVHETVRGSYDEQEQRKNQWLQQFVIAFGTDENDESMTFDGTIPQALMMMNGDLMQRATGTRSGSFLHRVAVSDTKPGNKINQLYIAALAREPSKRELVMANHLYTARQGDVGGALQDIWWALLNSNEFIINH